MSWRNTKLSLETRSFVRWNSAPLQQVYSHLLVIKRFKLTLPQSYMRGRLHNILIKQKKEQLRYTLIPFLCLKIHHQISLLNMIHSIIIHSIQQATKLNPMLLHYQEPTLHSSSTCYIIKVSITLLKISLS